MMRKVCVSGSDRWPVSLQWLSGNSHRQLARVLRKTGRRERRVLHYGHRSA